MVSSMGVVPVSLKFSNQVHVFRCRRELFLERGMRQGDQSLRPLRGGEALQIRDAVFGNYIMNICTRCRDRTGKPRDNLVILPSLIADWKAMNDIPPLEAWAPLTKSSCPPVDVN